MRLTLSAVLFASVVGIGSLSAQTTVLLSTSVNPAVFGQPLTLNATVTPTAATGKVTFYDGATVLGTSTLSAGKAALVTEFVQAGNRSLKAYYAGDGGHAPASSPVVAQKATTASSSGFNVNNISLAWPSAVAVGDFNGDGKADLVAAGPYAITILLGNGDGTFKTASSVPNTEASTTTIAVADFNLDGKLDVAVSAGESYFVVLLGNGDGTLQAPVQYQPLGNIYALTTGDFNGDGKPDLAVAEFQTVAILLGNGDGSFRAPISYTVSGPVYTMATGDFNGDDKTDIVVNGFNGLDLLLGRGDGTFQPKVTYPVGAAPSATPGGLAVGDFNGDGKLDVVYGNVDWGVPVDVKNLSILIGNGDGTFQPAVTYLSSTFPAAIVVSDFNGDGKADLAVANYMTETVSILLGKGDGTFGPPLNQNLTFGPGSIAVADFDGNGSVDVVVPSSSGGSAPGGNAISVLLGTNNPNFAVSFTENGTVTQGQTGVTYVLAAQNIGFGSVTGQAQLTFTMGAGLTITGTQAPGWNCSMTSSSGNCSRSDNVASGQSYPFITLTVNVSAFAPANSTSTATLSFPSQSTLSFPASIATTILQTQTINFPAIPNHTFGDPSFSDNITSTSGLPVTVLSTGACSVLGPIVTIDGAGTCTLTASQTGDGYWAPAATVIRTFNINGASTAVTLAAAPSPSQLGKPITLTATITPSRTLDRVTFFDGTNILGIAPVIAGSASMTTQLPGPGKHSLKAYYGGISSPVVVQTVNSLGLNALTGPITVPSITAVQSVAAGDFNGDGRVDLVVATSNSPYLTVLPGNGDGTFRPGSTAYAGAPYFYVQSVSVGDFNGDGKADLVVTNYGSGLFAILLGNGDGTFQTGIISLAYRKQQSAPNAVYVCDLNGDGKADLVFANNIPNTIDVLLGNGDGTFGTPVDIPIPDTIFTLLIGDFNGDGKADLLIQGDATYRVFPGNGDGTFQPAISNPANSSGTSTIYLAGDFNNDGKLDLAFFAANNRIGILLGNGDGTFQSERDYAAAPSGDYMYSLQLSNANPNQKLDLVTISSSGVNVLPGNGDGTFGAVVSYPNPLGTYYITSIVSADFNADGRPDLAFAAYYSGLTVLLGSGIPTLGISLTHSGVFTAGQTNATYSIAVQNTGFAGTTGTLTVNGNFPAPLQVQSLGGAGWTCSVATVQCTRTDSLPAGGSYPAINVTVSVTSGPGSVVSQASVAGVALATAFSADFTIIAAAAPAQLKFTSQPSNATVGTALSAVVVQVQDALGNVVTSSTAPVSITSSPAGVTATVPAVNGIATFSNLVFSAPGTYTLTATSPGLASAATSAFSIPVPPSVVIDSPAAGAVITSGNAIVSGWAIDNTTTVGTAISGVQVKVDGVVVGTAMYGGGRPDVCAAFPVRPGCPNVGYTYSLDTSKLTTGSHTITVTASNSDSTPHAGSASVTVSVNAPSVGLASKIGIVRSGTANNVTTFSTLEDSNGNSAYDAGVDRFIASFFVVGNPGFPGLATDLAVSGDWLGTGHSSVGIYRPTTGQWFLDTNNNGIFDAGDTAPFGYGGIAGDKPVVGDWNGIGKSCVGIFRQGFLWVLDANCNNAFDDADYVFPFGGVGFGTTWGDIPVTGSWTGNGKTRVGFVRACTPPVCSPVTYPFLWVFDNADANAGPAAATHQPAPGAFGFGGVPGDIYVTGDWLGTGITRAGIYRQGNWLMDLIGAHSYDTFYQFGGLPVDQPIVGKW